MRSLPLSVGDLWLAWERVQENAGCAGADGVTVAQFGHRAARAIPALLERVAEERYRPYPLLKIVVEKKPGGSTRTLLVPAVGTGFCRRRWRGIFRAPLKKSFSSAVMDIVLAGRLTGPLRASGSAMNWGIAIWWMRTCSRTSTAWTIRFC